jgi:D-alanyl-D-alanine dipeptidase
MSKKLVNLSLFFLLLSPALAQQHSPNKYGVRTIAGIKDYNDLITKDSSKALIALKDVIPEIMLDIRYATPNNFMQEPMYKSAAAFLSYPAAMALKSVQNELKQRGYGLKIFDGYRPYTVTVAFYEKVKDTVFVASPYRGSRHNRGCAVDLTIIDLKTGKELLMPTPFDDFTEKAHTNYQNLPSEVIKNRELLKEVMVENGFEIYADEWWHYDYKGWKNHPLMDLSFEELSKSN